MMVNAVGSPAPSGGWSTRFTNEIVISDGNSLKRRMGQLAQSSDSISFWLKRTSSFGERLSV